MSCPENSGISVRRIIESDIAQIAIIESETFSEPWSRSALALLLTEEYPSFCALGENGELIGYLSAQRALDELQIINVAIREPFRGKGLGGLLLEAAEEYCRTREIKSVSLEVRVSNLPALRLYEKHGYRSAGIRRNFYRKPTEDAAVMIKNLI